MRAIRFEICNEFVTPKDIELSGFLSDEVFGTEIEIDISEHTDSIETSIEGYVVEGDPLKMTQGFLRSVFDELPMSDEAPWLDLVLRDLQEREPTKFKDALRRCGLLPEVVPDPAAEYDRGFAEGWGARAVPPAGASVEFADECIMDGKPLPRLVPPSPWPARVKAGAKMMDDFAPYWWDVVRDVNVGLYQRDPVGQYLAHINPNVMVLEIIKVQDRWFAGRDREDLGFTAPTFDLREVSALWAEEIVARKIM